MSCKLDSVVFSYSCSSCWGYSLINTLKLKKPYWCLRCTLIVSETHNYSMSRSIVDTPSIANRSALQSQCVGRQMCASMADAPVLPQGIAFSVKRRHSMIAPSLGKDSTLCDGAHDAVPPQLHQRSRRHSEPLCILTTNEPPLARKKGSVLETQGVAVSVSTSAGERYERSRHMADDPPTCVSCQKRRGAGTASTASFLATHTIDREGNLLGSTSAPSAPPLYLSLHCRGLVPSIDRQGNFL